MTGRSAWRFNIACSPLPSRSAVGAGNRCGLSFGDSGSVAARQSSRSAAASRDDRAEEKTGGAEFVFVAPTLGDVFG